MNTFLIAFYETVFVFLICVLSGTLIGTTYVYMQRDLFHPIVLLNGMYTYFIVIPIIYLALTNQHRYAFTQSVSALVTGLFVASVFYFVCIGTFVSIRHRAFEMDLTTHIEQHVQPITKSDWTLSPYTAALTICVGWVSYGYYIVQNGGLVRMFNVPRAEFMHVPNTWRYRILGAALIMTGCVLLWMSLYSKIERIGRWKWRHDRLTRIQCLLLVGGTLASIAMAVTKRGRLFLVIPFAFVIITLYHSQRVRTRTVIVAGGGVGLLGLLFTAIETIVISGRITRHTIPSIFNTLLHTVRLENFIGVVLSVPETHPFQYGTVILYTATYGQLSIGNVHSNHVEEIVFGHAIPNNAAGTMALGQLYIAGGLIGVIIGAIVFGVVFGCVYHVYQTIGRPHTYVRGVYPFVLIAMLYTFEPSIAWAFRSLWIRFIPFALLICGVSYVIHQRVFTHPRETHTEWSD